MKQIIPEVNKTFFLLIVLSIASITGCSDNTVFDEAAEKAKILELHDLQRTYHFDKMPEEFASLLSEDHISVNRGVISTPTRAENTKRFTNYFNTVEFEKWDDIKPPIIRFSDDGSMAYTIVNKEVIVTYENEESKKVKESVEYSWVAIYRKHPEGWKLDCVASTNLPSEKEVVE